MNHHWVNHNWIIGSSLLYHHWIVGETCNILLVKSIPEFSISGGCCDLQTCGIKSKGAICREYVPGKSCQAKCNGNSGECPNDDGSCRKSLNKSSSLPPLSNAIPISASIFTASFSSVLVHLLLNDDVMWSTVWQSSQKTSSEFLDKLWVYK